MRLKYHNRLLEQDFPTYEPMRIRRKPRFKRVQEAEKNAKHVWNKTCKQKLIRKYQLKREKEKREALIRWQSRFH